MGCRSSKQKKTTLVQIIIDSPPPSLPQTMHIINLPFCQEVHPASQLPIFEKRRDVPVENKLFESFPTNEGQRQ